MIEELKNTLNGEDYNISYSENGARMYETTGSSLLDLSFKAPQLRTLTPQIPFDIECKLAHAYAESKELFVKFLFYLRDVRGGMGERNSFRNIYLWLLKADRGSALKLIHFVPEYGRWDDLIYIMDNCDDDESKNFIINIIAKQLEHDINAVADVSLLAKWLPSVNGGKKSAASAKRLIKRMNAIGFNGFNDAKYRKTVSALRKKIDVLERHIAQKTYGEIKYECVPSVANTRYANLFMKYDCDRRTAYIESLKKGETKINAGAVFPHDVYNMVSRSLGRDSKSVDTAEEMWKALPDFVKGDAGTLVIRDGSGSMYTPIPGSKTEAVDVASALTVYFSERMGGEFHNKFITFSSNPKLVNLDGCNTLADKCRLLNGYNDCTNTDLEKTFQLILDTAVKHNLSQDELPKRVLIVSDMEFDCATEMGGWGNRKPVDRNLMSVLAERFGENGYKLPKLIFWNVNSRSGAIPMTQNDMGVVLVSGYSTANCKMVLSEQTDPFKALYEILMQERYERITLNVFS